MSVSIVLTAYRRAILLEKTLASLRGFDEVIVVEDGDDGGATKAAVERFGGRYFRRERRPNIPYSNPSVPINIGLRQARGEYVILQNGECLHKDPDVVTKLIDPIRQDPSAVTFASVMALTPTGHPYMWYCHPEKSPRPFFFCGAARRDLFLKIGGMEESFTGYGFDDDLCAFHLMLNGARFVFTDARVDHQWHPGTNCYGLESNKALYEEFIRKIMGGEIPPVANHGREWGVLETESASSAV